VRGHERQFPGHGPADLPRRLFTTQRDYLLTLAAHVKDLAEDRPSLSDDAKAEIERRMKERYSDAGLSFLIAMNVDPIARELAGRQRV
jgi:hypothetical protein